MNQNRITFIDVFRGFGILNITASESIPICHSEPLNMDGESHPI